MIVTTAHRKSFEVAPKAQRGEAVVFAYFDPKNPAWFFGRDTGGVEGYFPTEWFDISEPEQSAVALRDYDAAELSIKAGGVFETKEKYGGWLLGTSDGRRGWVPLSSLQQVGQDGSGTKHL